MSVSCPLLKMDLPSRWLQTMVILIIGCLGMMSAGSALAATRVYWTNLSTDSIQSRNLNGTGSAIVSLGTTALDVAVDIQGGKVYWTDLGNPLVGGDSAIMRSNLDGSGAEVLLDTANGVGSPTEIELDIAGGKMYWTDTVPSGKISRANLDGSAAETLLSVINLRGPDYGSGPGQTLEFTQVWGLGIDLNARQLYWTDFFAGDIHQAALDGTGVSGALIEGLEEPRGIVVDPVDGFIFWTENGGSLISRAALDGTNLLVLASELDGVDEPFGITLNLATRQLYWSDSGIGEIRRSDLDGTNAVTVISQPDQELHGVALDALASVVIPVLTLPGFLVLLGMLMVAAFHLHRR